MTEVKFFLKGKIADLEKEINAWLIKYSDDIKILDIKYQFVSNEYLSSLAFSAMVIYKKKE